MKLKYCLRALLCLCLMAELCSGQTTAHRSSSFPVRSLDIGDLCPDISLSLLSGQQKHLLSYAGKPVVMVFMSIYCGTCVQELPQLQSLQSRLGDSVIVLLVLTEKRADVAAFFAANAYARKSHLPVVVNTSQLNRLFPHQLVPHIVWLSRQHTVAAISENRDITETNLRRLATNQPLHLRQKKDLLNFDENRPVLTGTPQAGSTSRYSSALGGYIDGTGSLSGIYHDDSLHTRYLCLNVSIPYLYQSANGVRSNLMIPEVRDTERLTVQNRADWEQRYLYTYELVVPATVDFAEAQQLRQADFDRYLGYRSGFEQRVMPCRALVRRGTIAATGDTVRTFHLSNEDSEWTATHITGAELVNAMNNLAKMGGPVFLDETGGGWISFHATVRDVNNVEELRKALQTGGLDLVRREQPMEVFVIRDMDGTPAVSRSQ